MTALKGQDEVGAGDARELRVMELRSPDRFVSGRANRTLRLPLTVRTVGVPGRVRRTHLATACGRRDALQRARRDAIGRCPGEYAQQRHECETAEHDSIVTCVPASVNRSAESGLARV